MITTATEDAIYTWIAATCKPGTAVFWSEQSTPRPAPPCIAMRLSDIRGLGQPVTQVATNYDTVISQPQNATLTLTAYAQPGASGARPLLDVIRLRTERGGVRAALKAAKVGILGFGGISSSNGLRSSATFEPVAILPIRLSIPAEIREALAGGDYIESATVDGVTHDPETVVEFTVNGE